MANLTVEFDTSKHKVLVKPEKSIMKTEEDLLECSVLACHLAICLADMASKSQNTEVLSRISILHSNFNTILNAIFNRSGE